MTKSLEEIISDGSRDCADFKEQHDSNCKRIADNIRTHILSQLKEKEHDKRIIKLNETSLVKEAKNVGYNQFRSDLIKILGGEDDRD